jgi:lysophospholipase L1-like esterase
MKTFLAIAVITFICGVPQKQPAIKIFLAGDSTMSIKEVRHYPETGWGMPFVYFWDSTVEVVNKAKNGRSTGTFIKEGLWKSITDNLQEGDYVIIQFGHNDEVPTKKSYTTPDTFRLNLTRFVQEVKQKRGIPVLCTSVSRRKFNDQGIQEETHPQYSALVQEVALANNVAFIDGDTRTRVLLQEFGPEHSKWLFLHLQPGEHPNYPEGKMDNTHFNELGARLVAQLMLKELVQQFPDLKSRLVKR